MLLEQSGKRQANLWSNQTNRSLIRCKLNAFTSIQFKVFLVTGSIVYTWNQAALQCVQASIYTKTNIQIKGDGHPLICAMSGCPPIVKVTFWVHTLGTWGAVNIGFIDTKKCQQIQFQLFQQKAFNINININIIFNRKCFFLLEFRKKIRKIP